MKYSLCQFNLPEISSTRLATKHSLGPVMWLTISVFDQKSFLFFFYIRFRSQFPQNLYKFTIFLNVSNDKNFLSKFKTISDDFLNQGSLPASNILILNELNFSDWNCLDIRFSPVSLWINTCFLENNRDTFAIQNFLIFHMVFHETVALLKGKKSLTKWEVKFKIKSIPLCKNVENFCQEDIKKHRCDNAIKRNAKENVQLNFLG